MLGANYLMNLERIKSWANADNHVHEAKDWLLHNIYIYIRFSKFLFRPVLTDDLTQVIATPSSSVHCSSAVRLASRLSPTTCKSTWSTKARIAKSTFRQTNSEKNVSADLPMNQKCNVQTVSTNSRMVNKVLNETKSKNGLLTAAKSWPCGPWLQQHTLKENPRSAAVRWPNPKLPNDMNKGMRLVLLYSGVKTMLSWKHQLLPNLI